MRVAGYETHPAADIFPMLDGPDLDALAADIRAHGLRNPVIVIGSKVLDGRNRLAACDRLGIEATFRQYEGDDPVAFVLSENLHRRHLNESQRAMVGARAKSIYEAEAKSRQRIGGAAGGSGKGPANLPEAAKGDARDKAARSVNVSGRTVQHAETVLRRAAPEVVRAVESGKLAVSAAAELTKLEPEKQREVMERAKPRADGEIRGGLIRAYVKQAEKAEVAKQLEAEAPTMPEGPFRVIVADPPWHYGKRVNDATHRGDLPYPSMTTEAICALPVESIAHEDAILWLWTTNAHMRDAYDVIEAWGFEPKTVLTWVKDQVGLGDWLRGQTEHCILAVRGKPVVTLTNQTTALRAPRREHSRKPDEFYALVEALCPGSKVEMFCRTPREGWARWGAEAEKFSEDS